MWYSLAVPVFQGTVRNRNEFQKAHMSSAISLEVGTETERKSRRFPIRRVRQRHPDGHDGT